MSAFIVPPLPGEPLHPVKIIADDGNRTLSAVYDAINDGRIEAVRFAGRVLVTESERQRLLRDGWPSKNPAATRFWDDWREFRRRRTAEVA
jgi:hypothetical protein